MSERTMLWMGGALRGSVMSTVMALLALSVVAAGCETGQPGVTNALGTVRATLDASPRAVTHAAEQTVRDMGLTIVTHKSTEVDGRVIARTENDREVSILIDREADERAQLSIRVGLGGDEAVSLAVLRRIRSRLAQQPTTQPATASATQSAQVEDEDQQ